MEPILTSEELAARWRMHPGSLSNWRQQGKGPKFLKIGSRVFYRVSDVEAYEAEQVHRSTVG